MARRARTVWWPLLLVVAALLSCTADPPPLVPRSDAAPPLPPAPGEIVVGVDDLAGGFNPHTLADLTPSGMAVAGLLLPSAFRQGAGGGWQLDGTLLESARVSDTDPFTVTYRIRVDASWSDSAPIAAEDFGYLADQMRTQPGVVNGAGYQLIDEVVSRDGGKTVQVVFRAPYPGWRSLFHHLLPAHLLKDAPGGWASALDDGVPVSGGTFVLTSADPARREVVLARNDRYWDTPAVADRLVLRQLPADELAVALRTGGVQAALFGHPDAITTALLTGTGATPPIVVPQPVVAHVALRPAGSPLDEPAVRAAVAAALDRTSLIATGAASGPSAGLVANAQVLAPSQPGYRPTAPDTGPPVRPDPAAVARLLTEAGYLREDGVWTRGGDPLELVVAAPANRDPYPVLAIRVAAQLQQAGIGALVVTPPADELFGAMTGGELSVGDAVSTTMPRPVGEGGTESGTAGVDIAVVPQPAGADPATVLASAHGCPLVVPADAAMAEPNTADVCDPELQPLIGSALTGQAPVDAVLAAVEPQLWARAVALPLYQHASLLVTTPELSGVSPGPLLEGPLDGAARWRKSRR
ncbi:MAG: ABC transporter family substrate-binding protein [Pseudonocardiaceae bacterium]